MSNSVTAALLWFIMQHVTLWRQGDTTSLMLLSHSILKSLMMCNATLGKHSTITLHVPRFESQSGNRLQSREQVWVRKHLANGDDALQEPCLSCKCLTSYRERMITEYYKWCAVPIFAWAVVKCDCGWISYSVWSSMIPLSLPSFYQ